MTKTQTENGLQDLEAFYNDYNENWIECEDLPPSLLDELKTKSGQVNQKKVR